MIDDQIILIPVYEPTDCFELFLNEILEHFSTVVIVNDGSGAGSASVFEKVSNYSGVHLLRHNVNLGKGRAIKTGINYCLGLELLGGVEGVITVDADGQHRVEDILKVSSALREHSDKLIMGCRTFNDNSIPLRSRLGNNISHKIFKWLCGVDVSDTQTGLRGIPYDFLKVCCRIAGERYEYETNMLLVAKDSYGFYEVSIQTIYENGNATSHFNPLKDSIRIYTLIIKYCMSSLLSVVIDYSIFWMLSGFGAELFVTVYVARICSTIVNFGVNRNVVFKNKDNLAIQLLKYLLLVFISGTLSGIGIRFVDAYLGLSLMTAKIIVELILFFLNYYIQRTYIFIRKESRKTT